METNEVTPPKEEVYRVYKQRYALLFSVSLLSISSSTVWQSYGPISTIAAEYYDKDIFAINWFSLVFYLVVIPLVFVTTYMVDKLGLKWTLNIGAALNCFGAVVRALGTSGIVEDRNSQYAISLFGQICAALAQSFVMFSPAKVSQVWFPERQRGMATTILSISYTVGIVVSQASVPFIVNTPSDIQLNNYIWGSLAIAAQISILATVTRAKPKTSPSKSAQKGDENRPPYLQQLKIVLTNPAYVILMLTMGAAIGAFTASTALAQQMLCPLGYSKEFAGLSVAGMILAGFVGAAITGIILDRTKMFIQIVKLCYGFATLFLILMMEFYLVPDMAVGIAVSGAIFGFFGLGGYSVAFELGVEITYPVEESISTGFIFLAAQINGAALVALIPALATSQRAEHFILNSCSGDSSTQAKDYTIPVMIIMGYFSIAITCLILFLKTRYKRQEAEARHIKPTA